MASTMNSIKRTLSFETICSSKKYCSDLLAFESNDSTPDWVWNSQPEAVELNNPFSANKQSVLPRWPLEKPETALTFGVLTNAPILPKVQPDEVSALVDSEFKEPASDDEFFDYDSISDTDSAPSTPSTPSDDTVPKRIYNFGRINQTLADDSNFNKKKFKAAWSLLAPPATSNCEAYYEQVLLASQSFNSTSLFNGLAMQTMAPAPN